MVLLLNSLTSIASSFLIIENKVSKLIVTVFSLEYFYRYGYLRKFKF